MKISEAAIQQILQSYGPRPSGKSGAQQTGSAAPAPQGDEVTLSAEGLELQRLIRAAQRVEDVRGEQVEAIRTKLRTGSYLLDPQMIANKMLGFSGTGQ